jgi:hypothetical protein
VVIASGLLFLYHTVQSHPALARFRFFQVSAGHHFGFFASALTLSFLYLCILNRFHAALAFSVPFRRSA